MGDGLRTLEDRTFLLLIVAVSVAFAWILWPFYGAVLWATILAIVFAPVCQTAGEVHGATTQPGGPRHGRDHRGHRHPPSDADHRIPGAGSIRPVREVPLRRIESRSQFPTGSGRLAAMGDQSARSLRAD